MPEEMAGRQLLGDGEEFCFGCHSGLSCFTDCCADVTILLTPEDVVSLSRRLDITTGEFIAQHTLTPLTKDLHLPVLMLLMNEGEDKKCPFVGPEGCTVYEDRPWSCRMYPIGMGLPPAAAGKKPEPVYFLFEDDFCKGREEPKKWTVDQWRTDQNVIAMDELQEEYRGIVTHPWFIGGRQLDPKRLEMFHTACYDLDRFREFVFHSTFTERFEVEDSLLAAMRTDDKALMHFAYRWLRFALFAEPTMKVRTDAQEAGKKA